MNSSKFPTSPILLVDDEEQTLFSVSTLLNSEGIDNIVVCQESRDVMSLLSKQDFFVIVLDMLMPSPSGRELLPMIIRDFPDIPVIIITAIDEVDMAVDCMKIGAFDYLVKPTVDVDLIPRIKRAIKFREMHDENIRVKQYLLSNAQRNPEAFAEMTTRSHLMRSIFQYIEAIADSPLPILITGETGVGKELIAKAVYKLSNRTGEFVLITVAGLDDHLFSDTLFGHQKGAFTGADGARKGLIEQASGGMLFLDEIGDLKIDSQVKLLRLLEEGKYYPLGADIPKRADAKIIVATNRDVESLIETEQFRKDLYYRLQAHHIHVPPLRERRDDIPILLDYFLEEAAEAFGKKKPTPPKELLTLLSTYHFPGNIRELEGMVFDAVGRHRSGVLSTDSFKDKIGHAPGTFQKIRTDRSEKPEESTLTFADQ